MKEGKRIEDGAIRIRMKDCPRFGKDHVLRPFEQDAREFASSCDNRDGCRRCHEAAGASTQFGQALQNDTSTPNVGRIGNMETPVRVGSGCQ